MRKLVHDCAWDPVICCDSVNDGKILDGYACIKLSLVVLFSPIVESMKFLSEFLDVDVSDECLTNVGSFKRLELESSSDASVNDFGEKLGFFERGIRDMGWGFCSSDSLVLGSSLVHFGLIYPIIGVSSCLFGSNNNYCKATLSLEILDVSGKPLECKCCELKLFNMGKNRFWGLFGDGIIKLRVTAVYRSQHFQRNIVRGVEGFVAVSLKQMEIARKLAEDCCKYGAENQSDNSCAARAALQFGTSHDLMENERETLLGILHDQVYEPLRALINGAPLEDARHLTHRYDKLRHEVEAQASFEAAEVFRHLSKIRESDISAESAVKLRNAEARLTELKSTIMALGREATAAMLSVESQQQQMTYQRLFAMVYMLILSCVCLCRPLQVDAEKTYHQHVIAILEKLYAEMILEEQSNESSSQHVTLEMDVNASCVYQNTDSNGADLQTHINQNDVYFIAKVIHPFDAQANGELSLSIDDYVVVRQVAPTGWSEGECKGQAGWFPSACVERQEKAPASKISEANSPECDATS
ncbi:SH3 domain-containing protein 1 [Citrus sinensis]|uniref:SH3 domain-containing protein 1 n=1 Tax=Citrus sinensis TaxID=2711 RepID=A0ACB8KH40_CITSI|nr:SH3 domain-containing protein 1 [Citrus sinensis]